MSDGAGFAVAVCLTGTACTSIDPGAGSQRAGADATTIRRLIEDSNRACLAGRAEQAIALIDREAQLSHPVSPDQTYSGFVTDYSNMCRTDGVLVSAVPSFEEVSVNGDTAVVRIIWSRRFRDMGPGAVRRVRVLQVWRRTPAGWQLWRGVSWPLRDTEAR